MTGDDPLKPIPWHVELWVALIIHPYAAAIVFGLPFGLVMFVLTSHGIYPTDVIPATPDAPTLPPVFNAVAGWIAGGLTFLFVFNRPY